MRHVLAGQTAIAPSILGTCEHEKATAEMSPNNIKSFCDLTDAGTWTNCREWGTCTLGDDGKCKAS